MYVMFVNLRLLGVGKAMCSVRLDVLFYENLYNGATSSDLAFISVVLHNIYLL